MPGPIPMSRRLRIAVVALVAVLAVAMPAGSASAHTDLESSTPADGATVVGPLADVTLVFTDEVTVADEGIAVADAAGVQRFPSEVVQDGRTVTARFDPALAGGRYATAWQARAADDHIISGTFSFTVDVPATTAPATSPATTAATATTTVTTIAAAPATTVSPTTSVPRPTPSGTSVPELAGPVAPTLGDGGDGESTSRIGRLVLYPAALVAIGIAAFAATSFTGRRDDLVTLCRVGCWCSVGAAIGAAIEVAGLSSTFGGFDAVLDDGAGRAALARIAGAMLMATGAAMASRSVRVPWRPVGADWLLPLGAVAVVASFAFDGHTTSEGPRLVHALSSVAHVTAAAVWAGGLVALAIVLWRRHRDRVASRAVDMVVRFSVVAMVALAVAGIAGVAMALFIEPDVTSYPSSDWGRLLLVKIALVAVAAALGAYNHFRVLPDLETAADRADDDSATVARARRTVTTEAAILVVVAFVSALLVAAAA